jgi:hypothetical protein
MAKVQNLNHIDVGTSHTEEIVAVETRGIHISVIICDGASSQTAALNLKIQIRSSPKIPIVSGEDVDCSYHVSGIVSNACHCLSREC